MGNIYQTSVDKPYHLSVGCLLFDDENKIVCHKHNLPKFGVVYTLVRESIEPGESPEQTIARGLMEEMGATAEIEHYLGSITANDEWFREIQKPTTVQKTTVYFLAKLTSLDESKRLQNDPESKSEVIHLIPSELIGFIQEQVNRTGLQDINESQIVRNGEQYLNAR